MHHTGFVPGDEYGLTNGSDTSLPNGNGQLPGNANGSNGHSDQWACSDKQKDFIYNTYNEFVLGNPWAKEASVRPKSIAREMYQNWNSFEDYVKVYGLERSEAVLLRHLSEVYKVMVQTVSPAMKTEEVAEAESFFETLLR